MKLTVIAALFAFSSLASAASATDISDAALAGRSTGYDTYEATYRETGMSGLSDAVDACYKKEKTAPSLQGVAECASIDFRARDEDAAFSQQHGTPKSFYFLKGQPMRRLNAALKPLNLDKARTKEFVAAVTF